MHLKKSWQRNDLYDIWFYQIVCNALTNITPRVEWLTESLIWTSSCSFTASALGLEQKKRHSWTARFAGLLRPAIGIGDFHSFCTLSKVESDIFQSGFITPKSEWWQQAHQLTIWEAVFSPIMNPNALPTHGNSGQWFFAPPLLHDLHVIPPNCWQFWSESSRQVHLVMWYSCHTWLRDFDLAAGRHW